MFKTSPESTKRDIYKSQKQAVEDYYDSKFTGLPNDRRYTKPDLDFIASLFENQIPLDAAIRIFVEHKSRKSNPKSALKRSKTREELIDTSPEIRSRSASPTTSTRGPHIPSNQTEEPKRLSLTEELIESILHVSEHKPTTSNQEKIHAVTSSPNKENLLSQHNNFDIKDFYPEEGKTLYTYFLRDEEEKQEKANNISLNMETHIQQITDQLSIIAHNVQLLSKNQEVLQNQVKEMSIQNPDRTKQSPMEMANPSGDSSRIRKEPNYEEMVQIIREKYLTVPWLRSHRHDIAFLLSLKREYDKGFNYEETDAAYKERVKVYYYATQFGWDEAIKRNKADEITRMGLEAHIITAPITTIRNEGRQFYGYKQRSTSAWYKPRSRSRSNSRKKWTAYRK
jgi:hypothetical protein